MKRRGPDRTIDSDPATQGALGVPKSMEPQGDPGGLHRDDDVDRLLDREERGDDVALTAQPHERRRHDPPADPQSPEELAEDVIALASQGGGSFLDDDEESLEAEIDRDAIAAGIVPQMIGQATLESASIADEQVLEPGEDVDDDAPTLPRTDRPRPGRTGVNRVRRSDAR